MGQKQNNYQEKRQTKIMLRFHSRHIIIKIEDKECAEIVYLKTENQSVIWGHAYCH